MESEAKLPRLTSFGAEEEMPIPNDFYRKSAPFMNGVNAILDKIIFGMMGFAALLIVWLAFGANLYEAYVNDGVSACHVKPLSSERVDAMGLLKKGDGNESERAAKGAASK